MASRKPVPPAEFRPCEYFSFIQLFDCFPLSLIKEVLCTTDSNDRKERDLPNKYLVIFVISLCFFSDKDHRAVFRILLETIKELFGPLVTFKVPVKSTFSERRQNLGHEAFAELFRRVVRPIAIPNESIGAFFKGLRLVALDSAQFAVQDTADNESAFGRTKSADLPAAYPAIRACGLVEVGTRVLFDYELGPVARPTLSRPKVDKVEKSVRVLRRAEFFKKFVERSRCNEIDLSKILLGRLKSDQLCLADRGFAYYEPFRIGVSTGAKLLFRIRGDIKLDLIKLLKDGSYLAKLHPEDGRKTGTFVQVRVIEYTIGDDQAKETYRLITNIYDPNFASNQELAELYHFRWEYEIAVNEQKSRLNVHLSQMRGKTAELILQELIATFLAHFAMRKTMHSVAVKNRMDVDELSFKHSVEVVRNRAKQIATWPVEDVRQAIENEILDERVEKQPNRSSPRVLKSLKRKYEVLPKSQRPPGRFGYKKKTASKPPTKILKRKIKDFSKDGSTKRIKKRSPTCKAERRAESRKVERKRR